MQDKYEDIREVVERECSWKGLKVVDVMTIT